MPDSSDIDAALVARLGGDATLAGYVPDGVWMDQAPPGATRFVICSLVDETDEPAFEGRAFENALYQVKAVMLSTANGNIKAAAKRIDDLLERYPLAVAGFTPMIVTREGRLRFVEVDDIDRSLRWLHRGGRYILQHSL